MGKKKDRSKNGSRDANETKEGSADIVEGQSPDLTTSSSGKAKKQKSNKLDELKQMIEDDDDPDDGCCKEETIKDEVVEGQSRKKQKGAGKKARKEAGGPTGAEKGDNEDLDLDATEKVTKEVADFRFDYSSESEPEKDKDELDEKGRGVMLATPVLLLTIINVAILPI